VVDIGRAIVALKIREEKPAGILQLDRIQNKSGFQASLQRSALEVAKYSFSKESTVGGG